MLCAIYRSPKRDQTYLYIEKKDDFSRIPAELLISFGKPQFAMLLSLNERKTLATADIEKVKSALIEVVSAGSSLSFTPQVFMTKHCV